MPTVAGLSVALVALAVFGAVSNRSSDEPVKEPAAATTSASPLGDVIGLGMTADESLRDDTIALREAVRRDDLTAKCMKDAGFTWTPEVLFPAGAVDKVAKSLGVKPAAQTAVLDPEASNSKVRESLTATDLDRYYQVLYGESAVDIKKFERNGETPGQDGARFASGGCVGSAMNRIGSVWDLRRQLSDDLLALQKAARKTTVFTKGQASYGACTAKHGVPSVSSPMELSRVADADRSRILDFATAEKACSTVWKAANDAGLAVAAPAFRKEHADLLRAQQVKYTAVTSEIKNDTIFLDFLTHSVH